MVSTRITICFLGIDFDIKYSKTMYNGMNVRLLVIRFQNPSHEGVPRLFRYKKMEVSSSKSCSIISKYRKW